MKLMKSYAIAGFTLSTVCVCAAAYGKVSPAEAAQLDGPTMTCMGAERAGSPDGVAPYTGRFMGTWPGQTKPYGYEPGPYAGEKALFTITAKNMAQYADRLTDGQKALLQKYPDDYRINVYPSHRDFSYEKWVCDAAKKNATTADLVDDGLGVTGTGGAIPFPIPKSGLEAVWNTSNVHRAWTEKAQCDLAGVFPNGNIVWGRMNFMTMSVMNDPNANPRPSYTDKINAYFYTSYLLPQRDLGNTIVGYQPGDFKDGGNQSWQYQPGTRRVREAPEVGFDYPYPPLSLRTADDDYGFNGSPERYNWKIIGKKEIYVPYDNFLINDPKLHYDQMLTPHTINPDYERYELHRVWVVEATLKPGYRHIYSKRVLYLDEDTWLTLWADNYDGRGALWRIAVINYFYSQESKAFHRGVSVYHDLMTGAYEADYLVNERGDGWWRINTPLSPSNFTPAAAARAGH